MSGASAFTFLLISCLLIGNFVNPSFAVSFDMTLKTDKLVYAAGETVYINGNLTLDGGPVPDALIALQINGPALPIAYRTLFTGEIPPKLLGDINEDEVVDIFDIVIVAVAFSAELGDPNWNQKADVVVDGIIDIFDIVTVGVDYGKMQTISRGIRLNSVFLTMGTPPSIVTTVTKGSAYLVWVNYTNTENYEMDALIAFTIYDSNNVPRHALAANIPKVQPGRHSDIYEWIVPDEMELGIAKIYAIAFSDYPQNLGWAYCLEKSSAFNVVAALGYSISGGITFSALDVPTSFSISLNIPLFNATSGTYWVHGCSFHLYGITPYIAYRNATYDVLP